MENFDRATPPSALLLWLKVQYESSGCIPGIPVSYNTSFIKRSPSQVVQKPAFWGRPILKLNPERAVEIPEQIILV
jgi:hypothetical protein